MKYLLALICSASFYPAFSFWAYKPKPIVPPPTEMKDIIAAYRTSIDAVAFGGIVGPLIIRYDTPRSYIPSSWIPHLQSPISAIPFGMLVSYGILSLIDLFQDSANFILDMPYNLIGAESTVEKSPILARSILWGPLLGHGMFRHAQSAKKNILEHTLRTFQKNIEQDKLTTGERIIFNCIDDEGKDHTRNMALHGPLAMFTMLWLLKISSEAVHFPSSLFYYLFYFV